MNTRQKEMAWQIVGGVIGAAVGIAIAISIQIALELDAPYFYLAGLAAGATGGAGFGGWLYRRSRSLVKIAPGVFITAPGWKSTSMAEGAKLTKGHARMVITMVKGDGDSTPATILEKYADEGSLELKGGATPVTVVGPAQDVGTGERRSFTATADGEAFEGDVTAFVILGNGLVFHASAPAGGYAGIAEEVRGSVASLERA